jgi:pimeloyl-ACP methyl ester carboxylesterase
MFAGLPADAPGVFERRALTPEHLGHCLRVLGTGAMEPLWGRLHDLSMPVWVVTGTADAKFDEIGARMTASIPRARHERLAGGHALPLETPAALAGVIRDAADRAPDV